MLDLNQKFDENIIVPNIIQLLPKDFTQHDTEIKIDKSFKYFESIKLLGKSKKLNNLNIYLIKTNNDGKNRVTLSRDIFKLLKQYVIENALVILHSNDGSYRLSYVKSVLNWEDNNRINRTFSNPKRFSYLLGPNAKVHTPYNKIFKQGPISSINDLENRFNKEVVSKEFFNSYKSLYERLNDIFSKDKIFSSALKKINISADFFSKRLLGQIVFCYFLQKKGWLGVKKEKKFGTGDQNFLRNKFEEYLNSKKNFFNDFVEYYFYEGLNKQNKDNINTNLNEKIPYIGGTLFEYVEGYNWKLNNLKVSNNLFSNKNLTGILDIFDTFNFTVDEQDPNEIEIGVDPEMLGNVFENLLPEYIRGNRGTFYTPRKVVEYICKSTLYDYLKYNIENIDNDTLYEFVFDEGYDLNIDNQIQDKSNELDKLLSNIKVCDPSIGSGAFAVIYLNLVSSLRLKLSNFTAQKYRNFLYDFKKNFIQNSIFGVDIDEYAIEITKLRLWLSLVVDQKSDGIIDPLPNLDFKIIQGDSLIHSFKNISLGPDILRDDQIQEDLFSSKTELIDKLKEFATNQEIFFKCVSFNKKKQLKVKLKNNMLSIIKILSKDITKFNKNINYDQIQSQFMTEKKRSFFPWGVFFSDIFYTKKGFDVIVGNPPYVDSEEMTKSNKLLREEYKKKYNSAIGNWDLYIIFIELGLNLLKKGGIISYIVKNTLVSAKYSEQIRKILSDLNLIEFRDYSVVNLFKEADVYPLVFRAQKTSEKNDYTKMISMKSIDEINHNYEIRKKDFYKNIYWDYFFSNPDNVRIINKLLNNDKFGNTYVSTILSGCTVGEAYEIKEKLLDKKSESKKFFKLINSGTIDPYTSFWGHFRTQYIKGSYEYPSIKDTDLKNISEKRYIISLEKKLIIANMTKGIECFMDDSGEYLAGKSTSIILTGKGDLPLEYLQGIINSKLINFFILIFFNSLKMSGGAINFGPQQLSMIPFPKNNSFKEKIVDLVKNVNELRKKKPNNDIDQLIKKIDQLVYKSFEINDSEIAKIENYIKL